MTVVRGLWLVSMQLPEELLHAGGSPGERLPAQAALLQLRPGGQVLDACQESVVTCTCHR